MSDDVEKRGGARVLPGLERAAPRVSLLSSFLPNTPMLSTPFVAVFSMNAHARGPGVGARVSGWSGANSR